MARVVSTVKKAVKKTKSVSAVKKAVKKSTVSVAIGAKAKKKPKSDEGRAWLCYMRADGVHVRVPLDGDYSVPPPKELWPDGEFQWPPPPDQRGNLEATDCIMMAVKK